MNEGISSQGRKVNKAHKILYPVKKKYFLLIVQQMAQILLIYLCHLFFCADFGI